MDASERSNPNFTEPNKFGSVYLGFGRSLMDAIQFFSYVFVLGQFKEEMVSGDGFSVR